MRKLIAVVLAGILSALASTGAQALTADLTESYSLAFKNGIASSINPVPLSGLGTFTITYSGAGSYNALAYFDYDMTLNSTGFTKEYGNITGTPDLSKQSWEIDEPGYSFGNLAANFQSGTLDNSTGVPDASNADDAAMAMGWKFDLLAGQTAYLTFTVSDKSPGGVFLTQTDALTNESIFLNSSLRITDNGGPTVPEPSTLVLLGSSLAGLAFCLRKRKNA